MSSDSSHPASAGQGSAAARGGRGWPSMAAMDAWYTGYAISVPAIAGSLLSIIYYGAAIWALMNLAVRRYPFVIPRRAVPFVMAGLAYCVGLALAGLLSPGREALPGELASTLAFVVVPLLIARYRFSDPAGALAWLVGCAPIGAALGFGIALFQFLVLQMTVQGGAGNASVFGLTMALLGAVSLAGALSGDLRRMGLALAGFGFGVAGVMLSDTRSFYPIILIAPALMLLCAGRQMPRRTMAGLFAVALIVSAAAALLSGDKLVNGVRAAVNDIVAMKADRMQTSLGVRVALWRASAEAFAESPIVGHGPQNKMAAVKRHLGPDQAHLRYTHVHNAWLDTAVAGGLLALVPFLALCLTPLLMIFGSAGERRERRYVVLSVLAVFFLASLVGMPFTHDLTVVLFVLPLIIVAASDPIGLRS